MSIQLFLIRHGQSVGNAGFRTLDHRTMPLTDLGRKEADELADSWEDTPDVIFMSPFQRAVDTALPTIRRFPNARIQFSDDLKEFTYLSPATCVNSTKEERRPRVDAYWKKCDPTYVDGADAESFKQLADRTHHFVEVIRSFSNWTTVFAFSHMLCITCIRSWIEHPELSLEERMRTFREYPFINNTECLRFEL